MSKRRFAKGTHVAWQIDVERGYRDAGASHWVIVDIEDVPGGRTRVVRPGRVRVGDLLERPSDAPETTIEPSRDPGKVIVTSEVDLVVQEYGDVTPRAAGDAVEVSYGSVIRAGAVLVAPLYDEQARSVREGRMVLPVIGERTTVEARRDAGDEAVRIKRSLAASRGWVLVVVAGALALLLAIGGTLLSLDRPRLLPDRVLVVAHGFTKELHKVARESISRHLQKAGFAVELLPGEARLQNPVTPAALEPSAREHGARHIVVLSADDEHLPRGETTRRRQFMHITGRVYTLEAIEQAAPHDVTLGRGSGLWSDHPTLIEEAVDTLWPELGADLVRSEPVASYVERLRSSGDRPRGADLLLATLEAARAHHEAEERRAARCLRDSEEHLADRGAGGALRCLSTPCTEEFPVGFTPDGSKALIQVWTDRHFFPLTRPTDVAFADEPQRLELVEIATGARQTVAVVEAFHGPATVSDDGRWAVFSEVIGRGRSLMKVDLHSGASEVVKDIRVHPAFFGRAEFPAVAADGRWIAFFGHEWSGSDGRTVVIIDEAGHETEAKTGPALGIRRVALTLRGDESPRELLAVRVDHFVPSEEVDVLLPHEQTRTAWYEQSKTPLHAHIALVDPESGAVVTHVGDEDHPASGLFGVRDGALVFAFQRGEQDGDATDRAACGLALYHPATSTVTYRTTRRCLDDGQVAADGVLLASVDLDDRGTRLVVVDLDTGELQRLTTNDVDEGPPVVSRDGRLVLFARGGAPDGRHDVTGVCLLEQSDGAGGIRSRR